MKRTPEIIKTEELLREYRTLKAISNSIGLPEEKKSSALDKVNIIDLAMGTLTEKEISIINLRYFNRLTLSELSSRINITPQQLCHNTSKIVAKMNKCILV